jgi:hypothetical protein
MFGRGNLRLVKKKEIRIPLLHLDSQIFQIFLGPFTLFAPDNLIFNNSLIFNYYLIFFRCAPDWESSEHTVYTIYWFLAGFLLPLAIILFSSVQTLHHLRKVTTKQDKTG